jgi:hypothetical protein
MTDDERMQRESSLIATIRTNLPDFAKACADETDLVLLHQDAFAADYQDDEYVLLGMAIWSPWERSAYDRKEPKLAQRRRENSVRYAEKLQPPRCHNVVKWLRCYN